MWRRCSRLLGSTNRYTDGSGRRLDTSELPRDLYLQPISNRAYPSRGEHWQPVLAGDPSPHKGNVIISGAGVVGLTVAALFAMRGWHTSVVEQCASVIGLPRAELIQSLQSNDTSERAARGVRSKCGSWVGPQNALVTRRAMDALEAAGLRICELKQCGVPVTGVMDHPGAYNSWLTRGLTEHHPFALKMLSVDLLVLRQLLEHHVQTLPTGNCRLFHEHVVEAVYPLKQQLVVKTIHESRLYTQQAEETFVERKGEDNGGEGVQRDDDSSHNNKDDADAGLAVLQRGRHMETSLTLHPVKWEKKFASEAVNYDLLICADGVNSHLRNLIDVEGFAADVDFAVRWFLLWSKQLSHAHIHRWLYRRKKTAGGYDVSSPCQVPLAVAFPRLKEKSYEANSDNGNRRLGNSCGNISDYSSFALMVYGPVGELERLSDAEILRTFCADLAESDNTCRVVSFSRRATPCPTIYCENLFNSVGLPSAVVVGDAAHTCNPFWLQGLAMGLEDGVNLLNQVDAYSRHFYDAIRQYSQERGCSGDALREITDRCLYYERMKHVNPLVRLQNSYQRAMNTFFPKTFNAYYSGASVNHVYSKSLEEMLNGRGYTSYEYAEKQQAKHRAFFYFGKVYT